MADQEIVDGEPQGEEPEPGFFFTRQLPLETETSVFILMNALDVFMTVVLLYTGAFRESNEIANAILNRFGIKGMIYFKFAIVAFVTVIAQVVYLKKPRTAKMLLNGGSLVVLAVVIYSFSLFLKYSGWF